MKTMLNYELPSENCHLTNDAILGKYESHHRKGGAEKVFRL